MVFDKAIVRCALTDALNTFIFGRTGVVVVTGNFIPIREHASRLRVATLARTEVAIITKEINCGMLASSVDIVASVESAIDIIIAIDRDARHTTKLRVARLFTVAIISIVTKVVVGKIAANA